jgi:hypothetical protein
MLGKSMSRFVSLSYMFLAKCTKTTSTQISLDADSLEEVRGCEANEKGCQENHGGGCVFGEQLVLLNIILLSLLLNVMSHFRKNMKN